MHVRRMMLASILAAGFAGAATAAPARLNFLWITIEDASPDLGCYGDSQARTPNLDRFAGESVLFRNAFSVAPVCAPSRSAIITGMYPTTIGTLHMRSKGVPPPQVKCFTEYLRAAGYFCTNRAKTDYNFDAPITAWDQNGPQAHWRNRRPGQPFFAVFNITATHEGQVRLGEQTFQQRTAQLKPEDRHRPEAMTLPPYYPDTPVVRKDWARYYDLITVMDLQAAELLQQLEADGLSDSTVVFFFSDHGRGLPRGKRWLYDSGIRVPLMVRWPGRMEPGTVREDLVSLLDLAPTMLSLAGVKVPEHMQGQVFLGEEATRPREGVFCTRDRMDETHDMIRCVRDGRYKYIRNFHPDRPYAQPIRYMDQMPTMQEWRRLAAEGKLTGPSALFMAPHKPKEELYDLTQDPHEIRNLAGDPAHEATLIRMREALDRWMKETGDLGPVPEAELQERMRPGGQWATTAAPKIQRTTETPDGAATVTLSCETPGASIAWTTERGKDAHWNLYSRPIRVEPGTMLRAMACRLGYKDSDVVRMSVGNTATRPAASANDGPLGHE